MWQVHNKIAGKRHNFNVFTLKRSDAPIEAEEDIAMSMALYSRLPGSVGDHIEKVNARGSKGFMQTYYCDYGDDSIGDCADGAIYVEGVSMVVEKHLQNNPLYRGQGASSRYRGFGDVEFIVPNDNPIGRAYVEKLRAFYIKAKPIIVAKFARENNVDMDAIPERCEERLTEAGKALNAAQGSVRAKAYDVLRGFLPFGTATNVAVAITLRQLRDHVRWLQVSDLDEVRDVADALLEALRARYVNSFGVLNEKTPEDKARREAREQAQREHRSLVVHQLTCAELFATQNYKGLKCQTTWANDFGPNPKLSFPEVFSTTRPCALPPHMSIHLPVIEVEDDIDIGSMRDLARHQSISKNFPIATTLLGVEEWYPDQLAEELQDEARQLLAEAKEICEAFDSPVDAQYVIPMAYKVNFRIRGSWDKFDYITELRTKTTVHPTLRKKMAVIAKQLNEMHPMQLRFTDSEDVFDVRRGKQTITEK